MSKTIFIIDDSESIRELVGLTLESVGYKVEKAVDGVDALRFLERSDIQLVITDLNMPNMDGIQLIKEIRKKENYSTIPILVLTTETLMDKKTEAKMAGATGWIVKPFAKEKLLEIVKKILR